MRLKTYIVATMAQAIPMIKEDLGADALILNTKKIKTGGFLGFFQKEKLEVTAAIDPAASIAPETPIRPIKTATSSNSSSEMMQELKDIKQFMVQQLKEEQLPRELQLLKQMLSEQEIAPAIQTEVLAKLMTKTNQSAEQTGREELLRLILENQTPASASVPKIICFIGPTGVGKTTTIAKIAARHILNDNKKVGLITADTYRIAAVEQLKTYGNILNIPVKVVESSADLMSAIKDFEACDLVLIDTAGRNYQQMQYVEELNRLLTSKNDVQIHLVLSLTSKYEDMKKIIDNCSSITIDELLLTKKDETGSSGALVNLICDYAIPIRYIANGQNVPDDMLTWTPELVVDLILEDTRDA